MKKYIFLVALSFLIRVNTYGGGFEFPVHSIKLAGIGNAGSALSMDAACIQFNSANMHFLTDRKSIVLGGLGVLPAFTFRSNALNVTQNKESSFSAVPSLFFTYPINEDLTIGFSGVVGFGASINWGNDFVLGGIANQLSLRSFNPAIHLSYGISDNISVGIQGGASILSANFNNQLLSLPEVIDRSNIPSLLISGSGIGFSGGVSLSYLSDDKSLQASLGYNFYGGVSTSQGEATLKNTPEDYNTLIPNGDASTTVGLPAVYNLGISKKIDDLLLAFSVSLYDWTGFKNLTIAYQSEEFEDSKFIFNLKSAWHLNLGAQYDFNRISVRGGVSFSNSAVNTEHISPIFPIDNQISFHTGLSYPIGNSLSIDAAYILTYGLGIEGTNHLSGIDDPIGFKSLINIIGLGISYNL